MSFFKKTPVPAPKPEPIIIEPEVKPEPVKPAPPAPKKFEPIAKTTIGKGITFIGNFETKDPMILNGAIRGDINSSALIEVSSTGSYKGNACMHDLVLSGEAEGTVDCEDLTKLTSTATMTGNLTTARLITDDGSSFIGDMKLQKKGVAPQKTAAPAPASAPAAASSPAPATPAPAAGDASFEKAAKAAEWAANEFEAIQKASQQLEKDLADADGDIAADEEFIFGKK